MLGVCIRLDRRETEWEGVNWIHLAQDSDRRQALVTTVINFRIPYKSGNFLTIWAAIGSWRTSLLNGISSNKYDLPLYPKTIDASFIYCFKYTPNRKQLYKYSVDIEERIILRFFNIFYTVRLLETD